MTAPATRVVTPRASNMVLRATSSPALQATVSQGDPLLVTDRLPDGFLEVDWAQRRWFVLENDTQPWTGQGAAAAGSAPGRSPLAASQRADTPPQYSAQRGTPSDDYRPRQRGLNFVTAPVPLLPIFAAVCGLLLVIGAFGEWLQYFGQHYGGIEFLEGKLALGLGLVAAVVSGVRVMQPQFRSGLMVAALICFVAMLGLGIWDATSLTRLVSQNSIDIGGGVGLSFVKIGWGLGVVVLASGAGALLSVIQIILDTKRRG
jgi:hypothetical protein